MRFLIIFHFLSIPIKIHICFPVKLAVSHISGADHDRDKMNLKNHSRNMSNMLSMWKRFKSMSALNFF